MIDKLISICGKENVSVDLLDKLVYNYDASQKKGSEALVIVWPRNEEQIRKIIVYCNRTNRNIVIRGSGTNLGGCVLPNNSIVLDLSKLNRVLEINLREKYVIVESGITVGQLKNILKKYKKMFPILPFAKKIATIGGMAGNDSFGEYSLKYGRMFDNILEIDVVDGTGKIFRTQRTRDFIGTEGCLGIITKIKLKIIDEIIPKSLDLLSFDRGIELINKVKEIKDNENILSMQYINKHAAEVAKIEKKHYLIVEYLSNEGKIQDIKNKKIIWNVKEKIFKGLISEKYNFIESPSLDLNRAIEFLKLLRKKNIGLISHISLGIHLLFLKESQLYELREIFQKIRENDGSVSNLGIGIKYKKSLSEKSVNEIKSLKAKYDPNNILNKGKLIN